ncbi:MAG: hypothetical protein IPP90_20270 [Gemmatimonadaceae bacterium]|nr:hypothetical protein [Gemmatimonadaceae bacterium]
MPSDLKGLSSADRVPLPTAHGTAGSGASEPSRALTRIAPIDPRDAVSTPQHPLGRSGLDLLNLLATTDLVAPRQATGMVEMEVGLEQARGSLLRNLPADALTALDLVWEGAKRTEEGWYLRSGSLAVLGLPGESERVAEEGLAVRPGSLALRFMQSVSRMALGDLAGARSVLQQALQGSPGELLLLVQHALVQAKQGDSRGADALLSRPTAAAEHPALTWGRAVLRTIVADNTRQRSRPTPIDWPVAMPTAVRSARVTPASTDHIFAEITEHLGDPSATRIGHRTPPITSAAVGADALASDSAKTDVAASALERFGARIVMRPTNEVAREARMLMRAFSAGGTLASATNADQAHAARTVLTTFLGATTGEGAETPAPVRTMVEQLLPLLQDGRFDDAERAVRRQSMLVREPIGRLLLAIVRGAQIAEGQRNPAVNDSAPENGGMPHARTAPAFTTIADERLGTPSAGMMAVRGDSERAPLIPVRLGLGLLEETSASRAATATTSPDAAYNAEHAGMGWGAAREIPTPAIGNEWAEGAGVRAVALVCVALAATALVTSHGAIAIGLAAGAVWLGLRRSGREGDRRGTHDRTSPQ